jgi:hypothetical protein
MFSAVYEEARCAFAACSPGEMADLSGAIYDSSEKTIHVAYFGRTYQVSHPEGTISSPYDPVELPLEEKALILQYLSQATGEPLSGRWIAYAELPNGMLHNQPFRVEAVEPLADTFGSRPEKLVEAAHYLGGWEIEIGDAAVVIPVFKRLYVAVVIWVADDEFPASANMVFDAAAPKYLSTAALYVLGSVVTKRIKNVVDL